MFGGEYDFTNYLNLDVQLFYKDLYDLPVDSDTLVERDGDVVEEVINNDGIGRVYGLEVLLRHYTANGFFGWIAYTLSRSERFDHPDDPDDDWRLFSYDQTHILTVLGSYQLPLNWSLGARFRFVTGNLTTPVIASTYDVNSDRFLPTYGPENSDRVDDFHQLDIRIDKMWIFDGWRLTFYLDIQNIYNRANVEGLGYNYDFSEIVPTTGLPFIPSFGLRGEF